MPHSQVMHGVNSSNNCVHNLIQFYYENKIYKPIILSTLAICPPVLCGPAAGPVTGGDEGPSSSSKYNIIYS